MTTENKNKIDMQKERTKQQWLKLLDSVKRNDYEILSRDEQNFYVKEIEYKINGKKFSRNEVLSEIEAGAADISDIS
ncbi:hypothetical protein [Brevundimonas sp. FT23042]|jgi:hypothetical protein|uniref:hypothetical protein n=1 Tax=Brevundimonas sp. FT23042 TaxID=3393749 RepID=UPI003B5882FC